MGGFYCGGEVGACFFNFGPNFYQPKIISLKLENESPMYMTFKYMKVRHPKVR